MNLRITTLFVGIFIMCIYSHSDAAPAASPDNSAPLAGLPSKPREHVSKISGMQADTWLSLGQPAPDPKWGTPRGRSWTAKMAYAPDLHAAFLFGEGQHGWWNKENGQYMDDLWAYDALAHRWICVYAGADVKKLDLHLNEHGIEVTADGQPMPVAQMVHGYEGTTYDADAHRFVFMPCSGGYWEAAMGERRMKWLKEKKNEVAKSASPWSYDVVSGKWDRHATNSPAPGGGFGDVLEYVPAQKRFFLRTAAIETWWYEPAKNEWTRVEPKGPPPPFGIDPTACYDTKRERLYIGGGSYPVSTGPSALWIYDLKNDTWIDPNPKGQCCGGSNAYNSNVATMTYDQVNDVVVLNRHHGEPNELGMWIYDPKANAWSERRPFPKDFPAWKQVNAFYDPTLNVHVYHSAGDSDAEGTIAVYRVK